MCPLTACEWRQGEFKAFHARYDEAEANGELKNVCYVQRPLKHFL